MTIVMTIDKMKDKLKRSIPSERFTHSLNVMNMAVELARKYGEDTGKAAVAGLLHDCAKDLKEDEIFKSCEKFSIEIDMITRSQPELLHGLIGSKIAEADFEITDKSILNAITYHTTGYVNMDMLGKIIYIADYIEPDRDYPGVNEARELAFTDIDKAMIYFLDRTLMRVIAKGTLIHPDTVNARNYFIYTFGEVKAL